MIIRAIKEKLSKVLNLPKSKVECAIDEDVVDCVEIDTPPYTGVPAPILNPVDEWFASPYGCPPAITEKQKEYEAVQRLHEDIRRESEPENIHEVMYQMATENAPTTIQLDGWQSGSGLLQ